MPVNPENSSAFVAGVFVASNYAKWSAKVVGGPVASASPATLTLYQGYVSLPDGRSFCPFKVGAPVSVGTGASQETVTLTAVANCNLGAANGTATITGNTSNAHGQGNEVGTSSGGVFEACLDAYNNGGGTVVVDANSGATSANIAAARVLYPSIVIQDLRNGGGSVSMSAAVTLTSAQLKALQTTAITIAPAPGTGYTIQPVSAFMEYIYNTTAYTLGNADNKITLEYSGKSTALIAVACAGLVDQTASTSIMNSPAVNLAALSNANSTNLGIEAKLTGTTPALTLGDGTVKVVLNYRVIQL